MLPFGSWTTNDQGACNTPNFCVCVSEREREREREREFEGFGGLNLRKLI